MRKTVLLLFAVCCLLLAACSSTKVTGVWQDVNYAGKPFANLLVVSVVLDRKMVNRSEDLLVDNLRRQGVAARAAHNVIPGGGYATVEAITAAIEKHGFDGVLITSLVDRQEELRTTSPCSRRWDSDYRQQRYALAPCSSGSLDQTTVKYSLEIKLYNAGNRALVMSMNTETSADRPTDELLQEFADVVVKRLIRSRLVAGI